MTTKPILITGATGYIGGRLVPQLLAKGYRVRCLTRDPNRLRGRGWEDRVEIVAGDVLDPGSLGPAMEGCGAAYYLVHSMAGGEGSFRDRDLQAARNFATAAAAAGLERIIYLGGLGRRSERLSKHLTSRHEVGDALRAGPVPTTELRAAMIIGSGSASFEMLRALVCRLPVMVCPRWVANRTQPISIRSVLAYLIGCLENPATAGGSFDIGGPDVLTYKEMMERFAAILGLRRKIFVVPVLTPRLSAYWANLVTPVPASVAFPLIEGLKSETICEDERIKSLIPVEPIGFDEAVRLAMEKVQHREVETRWTNASLPGEDRRPVPFEPADLPDARRAAVRMRRPGRPALRPRPPRGRGRGLVLRRLPLEGPRLDGPGHRRRRPAPGSPRPGAGLRRRRDRLLAGRGRDPRQAPPAARRDERAGRRLAGVRRPPARRGRHRSELAQTAFFRPSPLLGRPYWYALYPIHWFIFRGMARGIVRAAERASAAGRPAPSP